MTTTLAAVRPHPLLQALSAAAVSATLMGLVHAGLLPLEIGVGVLQVLLVLAFLALVEAPASLGVFVLGTATAVAADVTVHVSDGQAGGLAGVAALALVAALLHQLVRRNRSRVTESLADTLVVVVLVTSAAALPAAVQHADGEVAARVGLLAAGAALVVGRIASLVLHRLAVAPSASRGWPGLVLALGVGVAFGVAEAGDRLTHREAMLTALACAAAAAVADVFVDLAAVEVAESRSEVRRRASLRPLVALLPFALVGPVLLAAVRLLERG